MLVCLFVWCLIASLVYVYCLCLVVLFAARVGVSCYLRVLIWLFYVCLSWCVTSVLFVIVDVGACFVIVLVWFVCCFVWFVVFLFADYVLVALCYYL